MLLLTAALLCVCAHAQTQPSAVEPRLQPAPTEEAPLENLDETKEKQDEKVEPQLEQVETRVDIQTEVKKQQAEEENIPPPEERTDGTPGSAVNPNADPTEVLTPADVIPGTETAEIPPEKPITRAYMARRLITTLGFKHPLQVDVSEFPVYRDVPKDYWDYGDIELSRERGFMSAGIITMPSGFFAPEKTMTYDEVYRVIEKSLTGKQPPVDASRTILEPFEDHEAVSDELAPVAAKLVLIGVLRPEVDKKLLPDEDVIREKLDVLMERMSARLAIVRFRMPAKPEEYPDLPVGQALAVEPTSVILRESITPGDTLYFAVAQDVDGFAKGGRFRGKVIAKKSENVYTVLLSEFESTDGEHFQTQTRFDLNFPPKEGFLAPGDQMQVVTGNVLSPTAPPAP